MSSVKIDRVETLKAGVSAELFNPFQDRISTRAIITTDGSGQNMVLKVEFQILGFADNLVKFRHSNELQVCPTESSEYPTWLELGTAAELNLRWDQGTVFGVRVAVEPFLDVPGTPTSSMDAVAVSEIHWFRLEPVYSYGHDVILKGVGAQRVNV